MHSANECGGRHTLVLKPGARYVFDEADSDWPDDGKSPRRIVDKIRAAVTIEGNGATLSIAKHETDLWYFEVEPGASLELRDMTIEGSDRRNCRMRGGASALLNHGRAVLRNVTLTGHDTCTSAGAVSSDGDLTIEGSVFRNNRASHPSFGAAAIDAGFPDYRESVARLHVSDTLFEANWTLGDLPGAAIINCNAVPCKIVNSTLARNTSARSTMFIGTRLGYDAQLLMIATTLDANAAVHTGGIEQASGLVEIKDSTFVDNVGAIASALSNECCARIQVLNSVLAAPEGDAPVCNVHPEAIGVPRSGLVTDASCGALDLVEDLQLEALGDNGGRTPTRLPRRSSPMIDAGTVCGENDQRGEPRPRGTACDVGAVEAG